MPDPIDVSQLFVEAAADTGPDQDSQLVAEAFGETGPDQVSQFIAEVAPPTGSDEASQLIAEVAPTTGPEQVSQLTIELLRGPQTVPPGENSTHAYTFDAGLGNEYYLVLQLSDSGIENRDKVMKAVRVTGKIGNGKVKIYGYGPMQDISVSDMEQGIGQRTTVILDPASTQVQQSKRFPVNIPNSMMSTVRVEGFWDGSGDRDRIDEILIELAQQGIRR